MLAWLRLSPHASHFYIANEVVQILELFHKINGIVLNLKTTLSTAPPDECFLCNLLHSTWFEGSAFLTNDAFISTQDIVFHFNNSHIPDLLSRCEDSLALYSVLRRNWKIRSWRIVSIFDLYRRDKILCKFFVING